MPHSTLTGSLSTRRSRLNSPEPNGGNSGHRGSTKVIPGDNSQWGSQEKSPVLRLLPLPPTLHVGMILHIRGMLVIQSLSTRQQLTACTNKKQSLRTTRSVQTYNVKDTLPIPPEKGRCSSRLRLV